MTKHEITMEEIQNMSCDTFSRKNNSVRGVETVMKSELKVGDKVVLNNYFTTIVK